MKTLVTGATGFVGRQLLARLERPRILSRSATRAESELTALDVQAFDWNPATELIPEAAMDGIEVVFHLAGESVAKGRWTKRKKRRIWDSRIVGTQNLVKSLARQQTRPAVLVCASAVGFYGDRGDEILAESSSAGTGYLAELCSEWEHAAMQATELGIRVVTPRIGIVLGQDGGALPQMLPLFRWGVASPLGNGKQWMPWIHIADLVSLLLTVAEDERIQGPCNATAPLPVTNRDFTFAVGRVLQRPTFLPAVPRFALRAALGEFADVLLASQRAVPAVATKSGFTFQFDNLEGALRDILLDDAER